MKLLYIPIKGTDQRNDDLYKAFQKRFDTLFYKGDFIDFKPDYIYVHSGAVPFKELKSLKKKTKAYLIQWTGDYRPDGFDYYKEYGKICDLNLKADLAEIYPFDTKFLPHGLAEWQFKEINPNAMGMIFIGNDYSHLPGGWERKSHCEQLKIRTDFTWIGSGGKIGRIPFELIPEYYNQNQIGISANLFYDAPGWFGNRPLMIMAAGCMCLMREFPFIENYFINYKHCIYYKSWEQIEDAIYDTRIVQSGQELAREYTFEKIVDKIINYVKT